MDLRPFILVLGRLKFKRGGNLAEEKSSMGSRYLGLSRSQIKPSFNLKFEMTLPAGYRLPFASEGIQQHHGIEYWMSSTECFILTFSSTHDIHSQYSMLSCGFAPVPLLPLGVESGLAGCSVEKVGSEALSLMDDSNVSIGQLLFISYLRIKYPNNLSLTALTNWVCSCFDASFPFKLCKDLNLGF